jgi:hypothetical protein
MERREPFRQCRFGYVAMTLAHDAFGFLRADALTESGRFSSAARCCACVD